MSRTGLMRNPEIELVFFAAVDVNASRRVMLPELLCLRERDFLL